MGTNIDGTNTTLVPLGQKAVTIALWTRHSKLLSLYDTIRRTRESRNNVDAVIKQRFESAAVRPPVGEFPTQRPTLV